MGQAKRRGTLEGRIATAQELEQARHEAYAEKWERERPEREDAEQRRHTFDRQRIHQGHARGTGRVSPRLIAAMLSTIIPSH